MGNLFHAAFRIALSTFMKESFFDFRERMSARQKAPAAPGKLDPLTVSQLTVQIERAIRFGVPATVHVRGEVSNLNLHRASGHLYFTLKDAEACIDCVMFRSDVERLKFKPVDGIDLLVTGRIGVYPQRGRYQLYATTIAPLGQGALELAFKQLREKLEKEGLFDRQRKRPLPKYPTRIALVTSRSTAALQDMLKVLRRLPWLRLMLFHVPVQGDGSAERIADALVTLSRQAETVGGLDLILLGRGGGSLEDLWEFNEEIVARAIVASKIPIVTGIGHEVDISIADLAADYHAHTPTEAAQVVTAHWRLVGDLLATAQARLSRGLRTIVRDATQRLLSIRRHEFFRRPTERINQLRQRLDDRQNSLQLAITDLLRGATARLTRLESALIQHHPRHRVELERRRLTDVATRLSLSVQHDLARCSERLELLQRHLEAISPQSVLKRGYTITTRKKTGAIVRSAREPKVGERLTTQFADGTVESTVEDSKQLPLFE
jgi:exodeoxyribonuclease VII large subunit